MQIRRRIRDDVNTGMENQQREYILRKQLESIKKELGEDETSVVEEFRAKIAESAMPDHVREQAERELSRFERMGESSPEAQTIRSYMDWLLAVPWGVRSEERLDPKASREVLDADHAGLEDVKDRIVEYIAVRKLREERGIEAGGVEDLAERLGADEIDPRVDEDDLGARRVDELRRLGGDLAHAVAQQLERRQDGAASVRGAQNQELCQRIAFPARGGPP